jgi:hypothetical protein
MVVKILRNYDKKSPLPAPRSTLVQKLSPIKHLTIMFQSNEKKGLELQYYEYFDYYM